MLSMIDVTADLRDPPDSWVPPKSYATLHKRARALPVRRFTITTPSGREVLVRWPMVEGEVLPLSEDFDYFVRKAAVFIQELLPSTQLVLTYIGPRSDVSYHSHFDHPTWRHIASHGLNVPHYPEWFRYLEVWIKSSFLDLYRFKRPDLAREGETLETPLPAELDYLTSHALDVANLASAVVKPGELFLRAALSFELPLMIIASMLTGVALPEKHVEDRGFKELVQTSMRGLSQLESIGASRNEGDTVGHGIVILRNDRPSRRKSSANYPSSATTLKRSIILADGVNSLLELDRSGYPVQLRINPRLDPLSFLTQSSTSGISLSLMTNGTVVACASGRPIFVRRSGTWRALLWEVIEHAIDQELPKHAAEIVARALLMNSFGGHGCLIGIVQEPLSLRGVDQGDLVETAIRQGVGREDDKKWLWHRLLPSSDIASINAELLARIASIDGATLITSAGKLAAYGHIVQTEISPLEGARTAAARSLSEVGLVIKISEDGPISMWRNREQVVEI